MRGAGGGRSIVKHSTSIACWAVVMLGAVFAAGGCAHKGAEKPAMRAGTGGIDGKLVDKSGEPFDVSLAGEGGATSLRIELISSGSGVVATTAPATQEPHFEFSNVAPGRYELNVYRVVPGKRTIAGSQTVSVDPGQTAFVSITLEVTEQK